MGQCMIGCTSSPTEELNAACAAGDASLVYRCGLEATSFGDSFGSRILRMPEVNVNVQDAKGATPMSVAAQRGYTRIVAMLLEMRACTCCANWKFLAHFFL